MKYKVIFIDWDKTLSFSRFWEQWNESEPIGHEMVQKLFSDSKLIDKWMDGEFDAEEICKIFSQMSNMDYEYVFDSLKISAQNMKVSKSALDKIIRLKIKGVKVVIATDNMDTFTRWTVPALKLSETFDEILNSYDIRAKKASKNANGESIFFTDFLKRNGVRVGEAVLIDDSSTNKIVEDFGINYLKVEENNLENHLELLLQ